MINISSPLELPALRLNDRLEHLLNQARAQESRFIDLAPSRGLELWHLDKVCSYASGNKFFKQALYWLAAETHPELPLLSFGGAYSNHLYALAAEAQRKKRNLIAVVRGLHEGPLNPCLRDLENMGASIQFVSRQDYRRKDDQDYLNELAQQWGPFIHVPEGGGGLMGAFGAQAIGLAAAEKDIENIVLAVGTGSTAAGVLAGLDIACRRQLLQGCRPSFKRLLLVPVIKLQRQPDQKNVLDEIQYLRSQLADVNAERLGVDANVETSDWVQWECCEGFQFGGYGKFPPQLARFLSSFESKFSVTLDPVYTAKAMAMACRFIAEEHYPDLPELSSRNSAQHQRLLFIHSGGLQGRRGFGLL
ncbi:1-aminocyclopropane-1-carboxylate deaminase/D-cysteine desulfhydrase [Pseudoteredinibacter isoporae]|uniref:1-aminocyclopropane-1-carboxylate deaminase n=1 Tax=Pseudoteredinibacter isoporae TaxID=570281 RepID=A0A7X0MX37_9GAMM|nr:hypothetical protein [Pseudoteredinibacter isoporae]MBB6521644.1 1-aminocyclopropane-1-carboxylate deaminase [Pseudoteredinibacter isoporae]NHO87197.1 hypothetical protein [Pseudoteredinibacter isoporae]NIB23021.1 hypothetical protein [Pseudoteredinibacter isoporae]